jgi:hypothetical protein
MTSASLKLDLDETFPAGRSGASAAEPGSRFRLVSSRDLEPSVDAPLLYRERAFAIPAGCDAPTLEAFLLDRLAELRSKLGGVAAPGRLVVLAGFEGVEGSRPKGAPRATLTWKDWRADSAELTTAGGTRALQLVAKGASTPTPKPAAKAKSRARISQAPRPAAGTRLGADDLIAELFEAMIDLHFEADAVAGAHFVLGLLRDKLHVDAALVSLFDLARREFVVVAEHGGKGKGSALLHRQKQHEKLVDAAHRTRRSVLVVDAAGDPRVSTAHWDALGVAPRTLICSPVASGGRTLGLIELANPRDGGPLGEVESNAVLYVAQQLGEFLADRGASIDEEAVRQAHAERAGR